PALGRGIELRRGGVPAGPLDGGLAERLRPHALAARDGPGPHPLDRNAAAPEPAAPARVRTQRRALRAPQQPARAAGAGAGLRAGPPAPRGGRRPELLPDRPAAPAAGGGPPELAAQPE